MNSIVTPVGSLDQTTLEMQQQLERAYLSHKKAELELARAAFQRPHTTRKVAESGLVPHLRRLASSPEARIRRLLRDSSLFDAEWYIERYPDIAQSGIDPVAHYLQFGAKELRDPGPYFSTRHYLAMYPDVRSAGVNPLYHYLASGWDEKRLIRPSLLGEG